MLSLKPGVDPSNLQPEILLALYIADQTYDEFGYECVITSLFEGEHSPTSFHYRDGKCRAVDLRTRHVPKATLKDIVAKLRTRLGRDYDVVEEVTHLHVEWDKK